MEENKITVEEISTTNENQNTETQQIEQTIDVEEIKPFEVETNEVLVTSGEFNENLNHALLNNRELPNQHPIIAIEGLQTKLDNIEALKLVRSNLSGHADYYLWGDTEDIGPGYFVRLGEDGMIHKCTNETIVLRPKDVPLDTNENGEVVIYALVGNITTADITKYYVVGTEAPYDIYAYDGIEYVQKSAYNYDGEQVIKTCHTTDMLGVTVSSAGFVGNDENVADTYTSAKATDINYALVATSGVVDVLCGHDIIIGDYVFPTASGWAAKSTGSYGYLVTALVQNGVVVQDINKEEVLYARIVLQQSMVNAKKVSDNVDYLLGETKRLDENITTFGNTAEAALKRAEELTEAAQQSANTSSQIAQDATNAAVNAQNSAVNAWNAAEQAAPIAQKAAEDAKVAQEAALTLKNDAIAEANELATQIATDKSNETLNTVKALEYRLDEYTVGQYSQAYGLTFDQAKAILPVGTTFIPMDEDPTATDARQEYKEVYADEEADVEQTFTVGYAYTWGGENWLVDKTVLITRTPTAQTDGDYWFVVKEYDGTQYNCGSLYRWESGAWKEVAIRKENVMNRTMAHLYQSNDTIRQSVSTVDGKVSAVETKVTETDARVGLVASVPTELVGVKPANYDRDDEQINIIVNETELKTNWIEHAIVKGNGTHYYVVGQQLPYDVYVCVVENGVASFTKSNTITYDGVNFYKINVASIFTTADEEGSRVQLNAKNINLNGDVIIQDPETGTITAINGAAIQTGTLSASQIIGAINRDDEQTDLKIRADRISIDGADISLAGKNINLTSDNITISSDKFNVDKNGDVVASNMILTGGKVKSSNFKQGPTVWGTQEPSSPPPSNYSERLGYILSDNQDSYVVCGIGTCTDNEVIIPSTYNNLPVMSIATSAFYNCDSLTSITIPDSVTSIGYGAFRGCSSLTSITIPDSVTSIGSEAFYDCDSLTSVTIGNGVTSIGENAFYGCDKLTSVTIGNGVTSIGYNAFYSCYSLTSITIPDSVTNIGSNAFAGCNNLTNIYYTGTFSDWNMLAISDGNNAITRATIYYYSENQPTDEGNYWHYDHQGTFLNLADGSFTSKNFKIDSDGNVTASNMVLTDGKIKTPYFELKEDGTIYASNADITGDIISDTGRIGPLQIDKDVIYGEVNNNRVFEIKKITSENDVTLAIYKIQTNTLECFQNSNYKFGFGEASINTRIYQEAHCYIDFATKKPAVCFNIGTSRTTKTKSSFNFEFKIRNEYLESSYSTIKFDVPEGSEIEGVNDYGVPESIKYYATSGFSSDILNWDFIDYTIKIRVNDIVIGTLSGKYYPKDGTGDNIFSESTNVYYYWYNKSEGTPSLISTVNIAPSGDGVQMLGTQNNRWLEIWCKQSSISSTSDRNEKNSIELIPDKYSDFFDKLQPVRYKFNVNESNRYHIGFISQDVQDALNVAKIPTSDFAGYIAYDKEDGSVGYGLRYSEFIALNTFEIQKLKKLVAEQDKLINDLTNRLGALEEKLK